MNQKSGLTILFTLILSLYGCGGGEPDTGAAGGSINDSVGGDQKTLSAPGAAVFIITPKTGDIVSSPVNVKFGVSGIAVAPAGEILENAGHHHLLIDTGLPDMAGPIPNDEQHRHFGKGQTETSIELEAGEHTLQLVLGDWAHIPHNPPVVSNIITITVE
jgi:hypothetical protein